MLDLLDCGKGKLDDPIIMTWALQRYQDARARSADLCRSMEEEWFHHLTLRRWIDAEDQEILPTLFRILPVERFSTVNSAVFERWKTWSGPVARQATPVLLGNPADAVPLFAEHIQGELQDSNKTSAVIAALASLPEPAGLELLRGITARVSELEHEDFVKQILVEVLLWPTAALDPGGLAAFIRTYLRAWKTERTEFDACWRPSVPPHSAARRFSTMQFP